MILEHKRYELFGKLTFEKLVIEPPFRKLNTMPNEACFFYVIDGVGETISEVDKIRIPTKESVLLKCGNYITRIPVTAATGPFQTIAVHFHPEILKRIYENDLPLFLRKPAAAGNPAMASVKGTVLISKYIESLLFYFENPDLVNDDLLILKLKEVILLLSQTEDQANIQQVLAGLFSPTTYSFQEVIDAHLYSDISIEELAQLTSLSLSSFKREFKRIYNDSPGNYLRNKKLDKAAGLLQFTDQRITDIAYTAGFNELPHFSKCFKDKFSLTPSEYRLNQKSK